MVEGVLPPCRFANVVLWNRLLQSFDYTRNTVSLNRAQMQKHGGGDKFKLVLAAEEPGTPNWLHTEGRRSVTAS